MSCILYATLWLDSASCRDISTQKQVLHEFSGPCVVRFIGDRSQLPVDNFYNNNSNDNGKRPDGVTLLPLKQGKCATWDVIVSDTLAQSYVHETSQTPGAASEAAAEWKTNNDSSLSQSCLSVPIATEKTGVIRKDRVDFLSDVGRRITQSTDDHCESAFLFQRLSVLIQCYNAVRCPEYLHPHNPRG